MSGELERGNEIKGVTNREICFCRRRQQRRITEHEIALSAAAAGSRNGLIGLCHPIPRPSRLTRDAKFRERVTVNFVTVVWRGNLAREGGTNVMEIDHFVLEARSMDVVNERGKVIELRQKVTIG